MKGNKIRHVVEVIVAVFLFTLLINYRHKTEETHLKKEELERKIQRSVTE